MGPPAQGTSGWRGRRDAAEKVLVLPGQGTGLSLVRSSRQRGGTGYTRDKCKHPAASSAQPPCGRAPCPRWQSPGQGGMWGAGRSLCCPFWGPFASVWCLTAQQTSLPSCCQPDPASPMPSPAQGSLGKQWAGAGAALIRSSLPCSPLASRLSLANLGCGRGRKRHPAEAGQPAAHLWRNADPRARVAPRTPLVPAPAPAAAASASQPPAAHFGDSSFPPGFYPSTLFLYSQPNPRSRGLSLGEGFARSGNPKCKHTGSVGTGTGLRVSPLQDLPSPRTSSCGGHP